ncbi:MAG: hypothetical protein ABEN55_08850, partial [Bradymonadaceae bacterium]
MYRLLGKLIVRYRYAVLPIVVGIALGCVYFAPQLQFNFSPQQFFHTDSDLGGFREQFADTFGREDNLLVVAVTGGDVFAPRALGTLRNATLAVREAEAVQRAESIATFGLPRSGESPGSLSVDPLLAQTIAQTDAGGAEPIDAEIAEKLRNLAMNEPLARGRLVDNQGRSAVILIWLYDQIQQVSTLRTAIVESLQHEQVTFLPLTGLIFLITLYLLFRRPSGVVLPIAVVLMAVAATITLMVWTNSGINIVNNVLPTVIFIIGIADSIHLLARQAEAHERGADHLEAVREMV